MRAHFRSDSARLGPAAHRRPMAASSFRATIAQAVYVGQGYRYRVRTAGGDVWVHAPDRVAEGAAACVVVPREALLLFPLEPSTGRRGDASGGLTGEAMSPAEDLRYCRQ